MLTYTLEEQLRHRANACHLAGHGVSKCMRGLLSTNYRDNYGRIMLYVSWYTILPYKIVLGECNDVGLQACTPQRIHRT
jgi:hypothetical protein